MADTVKVAIIGCGTITRVRHAPEYAARPDVEILGFYDPVPGRAQELAARYGGRPYGELAALIADPALDAVSVCSANHTHGEIAVAALEAGKHVLCEKPMAVTEADARRMVEAARSTGRYLMVGHNQRFAEGHRKARALLRSGELGRVLSFRSVFTHSGPEGWGVDKSAGTWFFQKNQAVMGAMADLGVHKIDLLRWLLGEEFVEVTAWLATLHKRGPEGAPIEVDDNAFCLLKTQSGVTGSVTAGWTNYGREENATLLYCEEGVMALYSHPDYAISIQKRDGSRALYQLDGIQTNHSQGSTGVIDAFVESILRGVPPEISGEEGLRSMQVVFACMESARTGGKVSIAEASCPSGVPAAR